MLIRKAEVGRFVGQKNEAARAFFRSGIALFAIAIFWQIRSISQIFIFKVTTKIPGRS